MRLLEKEGKIDAKIDFSANNDSYVEYIIEIAKRHGLFTSKI